MVFLHINKRENMNLQEKYTTSIDKLSSSVRQWLKNSSINKTTKDDNENRSNIYFTIGDNTRVECTFTVKKNNQDIELISFLVKGVNVYYETNDEKIVKTYSQRKIDAFYDTEGAYKFIKYDFSSMMVLLLMMLASGTIFTCEKTTEMRLILKSSKNGRNRLNFVKIVSGVISAELIFLLFRLTDVLTFCSRFDIRCFGNQIYSIQEFQNTPLSCTIGEYFIIDTGYKMLVILVMELLYLFI